MDLFESKNIAPMLIADNKPAFDDLNWIYELKLDGIRCIAYLDKSGTILRNKRNKDISEVYPELNEINKQVKKRCILDGEVFVIKDGKPDFYEVQRRSLMTNSFRIKLAADKLPVNFVAYDILYYDDAQITDMPLSKRKTILNKSLTENNRIAISRFIEGRGIDLYKAAEQQKLEGIVAKNKDSKYYFGKRTKGWVKCKALLDDDFVVCGYFYKHTKFQIILGMYSNGILIYQGHVPVGKNRTDYSVIQQAEISSQAYTGFPNIEGADRITWLQPKLVCIIEFMERTKNGGLRQPVFRGLRDDKMPDNCLLS